MRPGYLFLISLFFLSSCGGVNGFNSAGVALDDDTHSEAPSHSSAGNSDDLVKVNDENDLDETAVQPTDVSGAYLTSIVCGEYKEADKQKDMQAIGCKSDKTNLQSENLEVYVVQQSSTGSSSMKESFTINKMADSSEWQVYFYFRKIYNGRSVIFNDLATGREGNYIHIDDNSITSLEPLSLTNENSKDYFKSLDCKVYEKRDGFIAINKKTICTSSKYWLTSKNDIEKIMVSYSAFRAGANRVQIGTDSSQITLLGPLRDGAKLTLRFENNTATQVQVVTHFIDGLKIIDDTKGQMF